MALNKTFTKGNYQGTGDKYAPSEITEMSNMIGKIAEQVIRDVSAVDKLSVFDKMPVTNGDTIEQAVVKLATGDAYDSTGAHTLDRIASFSPLAVSYFHTWNANTYQTEIDNSEIRKVLMTGDGVDTIASRLVASLSQGEMNDKYNAVKEELAWAKASSDGGTGDTLVDLGDVALKNGSTDYTGILKLMKNTIKGFQYVKTGFNKAGLKQRSNNEDIYIIAPYQLITDIDVEELAGVFNLDKAEIKNKIIEIDVDNTTSGGNTFNYVYIVDRNAIQNYVRLYEMDNQKNAEGRFWKYYLHTDRMYAMSKLFNACYFKYLIA